MSELEQDIQDKRKETLSLNQDLDEGKDTHQATKAQMEELRNESSKVTSTIFTTIRIHLHITNLNPDMATVYM